MKTFETLKKELRRDYFLKYLFIALSLVAIIAALPLLAGGAVMVSFAVISAFIPWMLVIGIGLLVLCLACFMALPILLPKIDDLNENIKLYKPYKAVQENFCAEYSTLNIKEKEGVPDWLGLTLIDKDSISAFEYYCSSTSINAKAIAWFVNSLPKRTYTVIWLSKSKFDLLNDVKSIQPYTVYCCSDTSNKNVVQYKLLNPENKFVSDRVECSSKESSDLLNAIQEQPNWPIQSLALRGLLRALDNPISDVTVLSILFLKAVEHLSVERRSKVALVFAETVWKKLSDKTENHIISTIYVKSIKGIFDKFEMGFSGKDKAAWHSFCQVLFSENPKKCIEKDKENTKDLSMKTAKHVASKDSAPVISLLYGIKKINEKYKKEKNSEVNPIPLVIRKKIILENFGIFSARNSLKIQDNPLVSETKNIFKTS